VTWKAKSSDKVGFARDSVPEWPNLFATNQRYNPPAGNNIRDDYLYLVRSYFGDFETCASQQVVLRSAETKHDFASPCYMVCPGSAWPNKQLHPVALKRFLSRMKEEKGCSYLFVWGSEKERLFAEELQEELGGQLAPKLSLPELQALMRAVDLVIAMDSLPLHLAGTTDTPTLSVFGPSVSEKYRPIGSQHQAIQGSCPYGRSFEKRCPVLRSCSTGACIRGIDGDTLFETLS
jgi:heptosyltransferase-1